MSQPKLLFLETRPQFLILTPAAFSVGIAVAAWQGSFNLLHMVLALVGSLFAHVTVNVINDYTDFVKGTDKLTKRTPFSGGSGMLPGGMLTPGAVLVLGLSALFAGLVVGGYFIILYPVLLWLVIPAAVIAVIYTPLLTKIYITEFFPGFGFGPLLVIGAYVTQLAKGSDHISSAVIWASIPVGILVTNLLWINEIPDFEADKQTGRRHGVILVGKKGSAYLYGVFNFLAYACIVIPVVLKVLPPHVLIALFTIPVAIKATMGAIQNYDDTEKLIPSLGQNVLVDNLTPVLMTIGLVLAKFF